MVGTLLRAGHDRKDINNMSWGEVTAFIDFFENDEAERLVLLMNSMSIAFGGTAKDRKKMAHAILGLDETFSAEEFESIFTSGHLANPVVTDEVKEWALDEFDPNDIAFKPVK